MAIAEHVLILKLGVPAWNLWREKNPQITPDLSKADLTARKLNGINFYATDLRGASLWATQLEEADLRGTKFSQATCIVANLRKSNAQKAQFGSGNFTRADLEGIDLSDAGLSGADFFGANLKNASLTKTDMRRAIFSNADLSGANLSSAYLLGTVFGNTNLNQAQNLESCEHIGPSILDYQTIVKSGTLPEVFIVGTGLPIEFVDLIRPLVEKSRRYLRCFISYSSKDTRFAQYLVKNLKSYVVDCWYAPKDMPLGGGIKDDIRYEIESRDKMVLILSENSIKSDWVKYEVEVAVEKEQRCSQSVLLPLKIDQAVNETDVEWAASLKKTRDIGDFCDWNNHRSFGDAFKKLLLGLKAD